MDTQNNLIFLEKKTSQLEQKIKDQDLRNWRNTERLNDVIIRIAEMEDKQKTDSQRTIEKPMIQIREPIQIID